MHAPDGFLTAGTAVATGVMSAGAIGYSLRRTRDRLRDKQIPLAGITAAFVFAAQMVNFPVGAGTTGHLIGATLAAVLLGPAMGVLVVAVVVGVQALVFADGGLTALGYNTLNMAVIPAFGGYALFRLLRRLLPGSRAAVAGAAGIAAGTSVVLGAMAFSLQWLVGATAPIPFDTVFGAMVGVHLLIGVGEGLISGLIVGAVLAARADLVHGARDLPAADLDSSTRPTARLVFIAGVLVAAVLAMVISQLSASGPDGLERVAIDTGIVASDEPVLDRAVFADYATEGVDNENASLAIAGASGVIITLLVMAGIVFALRDRTSLRRPDEATT